MAKHLISNKALRLTCDEGHPTGARHLIITIGYRDTRDGCVDLLLGLVWEGLKTK